MEDFVNKCMHTFEREYVCPVHWSSPVKQLQTVQPVNGNDQITGLYTRNMPS